ncbi:uncharacterized protein LOC127854689 [Dreissena polymorpha]|uniref:Uncharacterized protein n=1 Tax=Dreissena polymorpha TaxID=45954 RepID=A0A9D4CB93_DREPO|nr:uncharacterized protein LOC127854689 [Dreissena polymorpha]KAH3720343.1 hypothetical protein DPMN_063240 [Dreissena polymorpha]
MPKTSPKRNTEIDAMSEPYSDDESAHDDNDDEDADKRRRRAAKTFPRRKKTISKQTTSKQATTRVGGILAIIENEDDSHSQTDAESMTSRMTCEYEYHEANPVDYYSSNFPSLLGYLGPNASYKLKRTTKTNKQYSSLPRRGSIATSIDKTEAQYGTFADRMKKKNDASGF